MAISVCEKARTLIKNHRISIKSVTYQVLKAMVEGDHGIYRVEIYRSDKFKCGCNNFVYTDASLECSHVLALKMHEVYKTWFPCSIREKKLLLNSLLQDEIPDFSLQPFNSLEIQPPPVKERPRKITRTPRTLPTKRTPHKYFAPNESLFDVVKKNLRNNPSASNEG